MLQQAKDDGQITRLFAAKEGRRTNNVYVCSDEQITCFYAAPNAAAGKGRRTRNVKLGLPVQRMLTALVLLHRRCIADTAFLYTALFPV